MEIKDMFIDSDNKLQTIVYDKLKENETYNTEFYKNRIKSELEFIREHDQSAKMLFFYDLVNKFKESGIGYLQRGIGYTTFFISYLLGIIDFNPTLYDLDISSFTSNGFTVDTDGSPEIICNVLNQYDKTRIHRLTYRRRYFDMSYGTHEWIFLITEKPMESDFLTAEIGAIKDDSPAIKDAGRCIRIFTPYSSRTKKLKDIEKRMGMVDYENFSNKYVYFDMRDRTRDSLEFKDSIIDPHRVNIKKPTDLVSLAECWDARYIDHNSLLKQTLIIDAMVCYKLAYLRRFYPDMMEIEESVSPTLIRRFNSPFLACVLDTVIKNDSLNLSALQRHMRIGYTQAAYGIARIQELAPEITRHLKNN